MPRKTKEQIENEKKEAKTKKVATRKASVAKKTTTAKKSTTSTKSSATKKTTTTRKTTARTTTKKELSKKTVAKTQNTRKQASKSKKTTIKAISTSAEKQAEVVEYYDLPYRYNQTIVKLLAQTPNTLFIYWDISDEDRNAFKEQYGEHFFEQTKPVLIVRNETLNYSFEVEINDFANSWYLHVADSKCNYKIELGRRPIIKTEKLNTDYIYLTTSNQIESPNDHVLFNPEQKMVYFRDIKTGFQTEKSVQSISLIRNMGKIYNIYDLYKELYQNEDVNEIYNISNPSSGSNHIFLTKEN